LPRWLIIVASVAILFHLTATIVRALTAPSGPWPTPMGPDRVAPPAFAAQMYNSLPSYYLGAVRLTHNYHFPTNDPAQRDVSFEVRLKDRDGNEQKLTFPDKSANRWVRHRQRLLAFAFTFDEQVNPPQMEQVAPVGQKQKEVLVWKRKSGPPETTITRLELKPHAVNALKDLVQTQGGVEKPSALMMLFVNSYVRYLCRTYGADKVEITRLHQEPITPRIMEMNPPPAEFEKVESYFGELSP
jgi:hypothetical protein